jgi:exopolysaccharide biosynthesis polyprenyl glycosylphosphotransferase
MKSSKTLKKFVPIFVMGTVLCLVFSFKAEATVSFVKSEDSSTQIVQNLGRNSSSITKESNESRSHAPEPTTMALIGGSLLSMIISFLRKMYALTKRIVDIIGAFFGLTLLSPLLLMTGILIKLTSKGPILYSQVRVGKDGKHFQIYKFRTMKMDAEKHTGPVWASKNDNRLTSIGGILRKSRIDEIPQFVNVLKGEMSLVGPRPERPMFVEQLKTQICDYEKRLDVKPGITGLAQVWHRYDETIEDVRKKIKYDVLYIRKACFWTDIRILLRTFRVVFTGAGAR